MYYPVICIDPPSIVCETGFTSKSPLKTAETYHVTRIENFNGTLFFVLAEFGNKASFIAKAFLVCSGLDETLLINHPIKRKK